MLPVLALLLIAGHVVVLRYASAGFSRSAVAMAGIVALVIVVKYFALRRGR
jgi:hypothetical protein